MIHLHSPCFSLVLIVKVIIKGYCNHSWINCDMAKSLAQARACEGLLASDLAISQLIHERVWLNPIIVHVIYLVPHFGDVLDNFRYYFRTDKTQDDHILAVVHCRKQSDYLHNHIYSYSNGSRAIVILAYHWLASSCMGAIWGVGRAVNRAI